MADQGAVDKEAYANEQFFLALGEWQKNNPSDATDPDKVEEWCDSYLYDVAMHELLRRISG